jgi:hypothetical protein
MFIGLHISIYQYLLYYTALASPPVVGGPYSLQFDASFDHI